MNAWSTSGLVLDLVGVMLLGADLVRIQRRLRGDAADRLERLEEVAASAGGLEAFLKGVSGDWREYERDEGRYLPVYGTFDHDAARANVSELKDGMNGLADSLGTLAEMMIASVRADRETATLSLRLTYIGLALIVTGFLLQIIGAL